jgi:hypothetical protein
MPRSKTRVRTSQPRRRSFAASAELPRWIVSAGVVLVGLILWLAVFSDASGKVGITSAGSVIYSVLYIAAVLGLAMFLMYRRPGERRRR